MNKANLLDKMSTCIADSVMKVKELDEDQYEVIKYGWYVILADLLKLLIILLAAQLLGIFQYMICTILAFGLLRSFAGGVHGGSWLRCIATTSVVFFGIVYCSILLKEMNPVFITGFIAPVCFTILYKYSPADHHNRPMGKSYKKRSRVIALVSFAALLTISVMTPAVYSFIILFSIMVECLLILPVTYKVTNNGYGDKYFSSGNI